MIKTFLWKCVHAILPLNERIGRIIPYINKLWPMCGQREESLNHIFMECDFTLCLFTSIGFNPVFVLNNQVQLLGWFTNWFTRIDVRDRGILNWTETMATIIWSVWKTRCDLVFRKIMPNVDVTKYSITTLVKDNTRIRWHLKKMDEIDISKSDFTLNQTILSMKINVVVIMDTSTNISGIALTCSDHTGTYSGAKCIHIAGTSKEELKARAASSTIKWIRVKWYTLKEIT